MNAFRQMSRVMAVMVLAMLIGCDGSSSKPKAPSVIKSPPIPANVNSQPKAPEQRPQAAPAGAEEQQAKSTKNPKPRINADLFAEEDPKNVFAIAEETPRWEIGSTAEAAAVNVFTVGEIVPETNSTNFEVLSIAEATGGSPEKRFARSAEFKLPEGFSEEASFAYSEQGLPWRIRGEKSGAIMALIPAGSATIGSTDGPSETQPTFSPFLETYYMDVTEVTLEQYQKFRDDIKQKKNTKAQPASNDGKGAKLPALGLPWGVAIGYAHWADKELPTEAEFEYAARGAQGWRAPWGNGRAVWPRGRTAEQISPVASFPTDQSGYGIFDLAGNAREWCSDFYAETAHEEAASAKSRTLRNWAGPKKGVSGQRVVKGNGPDWSAWHREGRAMTERHPDVGFRCVLRVKVPQTGDANGD